MSDSKNVQPETDKPIRVENVMKVIDIYLPVNQPSPLRAYLADAGIIPEYIDPTLKEHLYDFQELLEKIQYLEAEDPDDNVHESIVNIAKLQKDHEAGYVRFISM